MNRPVSCGPPAMDFGDNFEDGLRPGIVYFRTFRLRTRRALRGGFSYAIPKQRTDSSRESREISGISTQPGKPSLAGTTPGRFKARSASARRKRKQANVGSPGRLSHLGFFLESAP